MPDSESADNILKRAREQDARGDDDAAKSSYLQYLARAPQDSAALVELGNLALRTGYRTAACTAYRRAAGLNAADPIPQVNLGNALLLGDDVSGALAAYQAALRIDASLPAAHQGLSYVYSRMGNEQRSRYHRDIGFAGNAVMRAPFRGTGKPLKATVLVSAAGGDFNTGTLLDPRRFDVTKVFAEYAESLPNQAPEVIVINAIGDADRCSEALEAAARLTRDVSRRVINPPERVMLTGRVAVSERLRGIANVITPRMALLKRSEIPGALPEYPVLLRTPGHHTGRHFVRVDQAADLEQKVGELPGDDVLAIQFIDVRAGDGLYRKYRMMAIGGALFPAHAAVSESWKVHLFTSGAAESDSKRAEDAAFLAEPERVLPPHAWKALEAVVQELNLDYMGIDFGIHTSGAVIVFEANATMSIFPPEPDERWVYRKPAFDRMVDAFCDLAVSSNSSSSASKMRGT